MKQLISKILLLGVLIFVAKSCSDELETADPNRLSSAQYYNNETEAQAAIDAIYNELITDGFYQRIVPIYNDGRGDELYSKSPWTFMTGFSSFVLPATDGALDIFWHSHYRMIARANTALEQIPEIADMESQHRERLLGQAYFLRALSYFELTNSHNNVPLILETPKGAESFYPSNEGVTQEMVYAQVEADLQGAISRLPLNYNNVSGIDQGQVGRATKGAAQSLLGMVYLYQNDYSSAAPFFAEVINSGEYALAENYADLFSQDDGVESANPGKIFWAEFTTSTNSDFNWGGGDPNVNWRQFLALTPTYSRADFDDFRPTEFLYNEMREELTIDGTLDPRFSATIVSYEPQLGDTVVWGQNWHTAFEGTLAETDFFIKKFTHADQPAGTDAFASGYNYHIIRYADVLLMYAECLANTGNIAGAAGYVQQVRNRANLPDREAEFAGYSLDQFMDQIEHERIMELAIEGKRWWDIKRWGYLDNSAKLDELKQHDFEFNTYTSGREVLPISQAELDRNENLVGNSANN